MTRIAAIDCGTNSLRLLINDVADGTATELVRTTRIVRLGEGVDRTRRLDPAALERTRLVLIEYQELIVGCHVDRTRMVATSATRDATNRSDFLNLVHGVLGIEPEVVTGIEEAALSFNGAVAGLSGLNGTVLVSDIGGGSSELVSGPGIGAATVTDLRAHSMDVGAVRLTERHFHNDPPTSEQLQAARKDIASALKAAANSVDVTGADRLIGVAGSTTTIAAMALGLAAYDSAAVHGAVISRKRIESVLSWLSTATHDERAAIPVIHPGRVDVIAAGGVILGEVLKATGLDRLTVSETDILDGIAASISH